MQFKVHHQTLHKSSFLSLRYSRHFTKEKKLSWKYIYIILPPHCPTALNQFHCIASYFYIPEEGKQFSEVQ